MSVLIKGMGIPKHAAVNGEKDTAYKCVILAHPNNSVELVIDIKFASAYDNGHNIQRYPITEIPTPHGRLIDADELFCEIDGIKGWDYGDESDMAISAAEALSAIDDSPTVIEAEASE